MTFRKINFDCSIMSIYEGVGFVIRDPDSRLVAAGDSHLFSPSIPRVELRVAWADIIYARLTLQADHLVIEGNSSTVID